MPPDSPFDFDATPVAVGDEDEVEDEEAWEEVGDEVGGLVENVMNAVIVGSTTPAHIFSAPEL